jgi:hypothetical protein
MQRAEAAAYRIEKRGSKIIPVSKYKARSDIK